MRILLTIPHYYAQKSDAGGHGATVDNIDFRKSALQSCIHSIHQAFGQPQCMMQIRDHKTQTANAPLSALVHVILCTTGDDHLLNDIAIDGSLYQQHRVQCDPLMLGFECRNVLRDRWGSYDWYGYMEDDLIHQDPWFFQKMKWFVGHAGADAVLLPNRFERGTSSLATKAYVDGDIAESVTQGVQDINEQPVITGTALGVPVEFRRPLNPHSGCYFLTSEQLSMWMSRPEFSDRDTSFIGPLESAATLGLMKSFRIYKPHLSIANFLEIEHAGQRFICQLRRPEPKGRT